MPNHQNAISTSPISLVSEVGRCVACGLCLPHCPTYRKTLDEADSPRGRIMMMEGVLSGLLSADRSFLRHLDACLVCRACENACPNKVSYGALIGDVRVLADKYRRLGTRSFFTRAASRLLRWCVVMPSRLEKLGGVLRVGQRSGLLGLVQRCGLSKLLGLSRLERILPKLPPAEVMRECYPVDGGREVALFLGCVARLIDQQTLRASIFLLNKLGYTVRIPKGQGCCGALHARHGMRDVSRQLALNNVSAFNACGDMEIIVSATGCASAMRGYSRVFGENLVSFEKKVRDITEFVVNQGERVNFELNPFYERIAVHEPCLQHFAPCDGKAVYRLLHRIPGITLVNLAGNEQCCGAAGDYQITNPDMSDKLAADKVGAIRESGARIIVTTNFGCGRHMAAAAQDAGLKVEVIHPVVLLARQMGFEG